MEENIIHYCAVHIPSQHYLNKDGNQLCAKELRYENGIWICPVHGEKVND